MAGLICSATTAADVALVAATAKTVLQVSAPTNQRLRIRGWGVFFDGASSTAVPVLIRVLRQTTAGTMTTVTPVSVSSGAETVQATAQSNATVEPTAGNVLHVRKVHPQSGYERICPYDQPLEVAGGGRVGIEVTAAAVVNCRAEILWEE